MAIVEAFAHEFERHRRQMEQAMQPLTDEQFFQRPGEQVNSVAIIVKHLAGNMTSRWTDFLDTDGDKPWRDRDGEFQVTADDSRAELMKKWNSAWSTTAQTLSSLSDDDLQRAVTIRGEPHSVFQALVRSSDHTAYHAGQIAYLCRMLQPNSPWLTIAPGQSKQHGSGAYLKPK